MLLVTLVFVAASVLLQMVVGFVLGGPDRHRAPAGDRGHSVRARLRGERLGDSRRPDRCVVADPSHGEPRGDRRITSAPWSACPPTPFLSASNLALASVVVANVWRGSAFSMILQFAGLMRIPTELHEAADLEGLSRGQRLRWLILPLLKPVMALNLVLITIYTLNTFDMILPLTGGGPARRTEVIALYMYKVGLQHSGIGPGRGHRHRHAGLEPRPRLPGDESHASAGGLMKTHERSTPATGSGADGGRLPVAAVVALLPLPQDEGRGLRVSASPHFRQRVFPQLRHDPRAHSGALLPVEQRPGGGPGDTSDPGLRYPGRLRSFARAIQAP